MKINSYDDSAPLMNQTLVAIARILRDANLDPDERRLIDHFKRELRLPELIDHEERVRFAMGALALGELVMSTIEDLQRG